MSTISLKCGCTVYCPQEIDRTFYAEKPCYRFDIPSTQEHINKIVSFAYRGESLSDIARELGKCSKYIVFHFSYDHQIFRNAYSKEVYRLVWTHFEQPLENMNFLFEEPKRFRLLRLYSVLFDLDSYDFCITPRELLSYNRLSLNKLNSLLSLVVSGVEFSLETLDDIVSDNFSYLVQQSKAWQSYKEAKTMFYLPEDVLVSELGA